VPITPDLSKKLLDLKEESGLTFEQIGAEVGTSDTNVRRYLKGETKVPDRQLLVAIIRCMGGDPDELLGKKPPAAPSAPFDAALYDRINTEVEKRLAPLCASHDRQIEAIRHANDLSMQHKDEWIHKLKDELEKAREALIDSQRRHRRIMHILIGLLVVLSVFVAAYLIRDIFDGSWGYIHY
jgi:transcriptional regulator with XRE-family HTH domain